MNITEYRTNRNPKSAPLPLASPGLVAQVDAVLPRLCMASFKVEAGPGCVLVKHDSDVSVSQRDAEMFDTRVALESAGYRVLASFRTLHVMPTVAVQYDEPQGEHCQGQHGCGASKPSECKCHDSE